jgi:hypothetical protein
MSEWTDRVDALDLDLFTPVLSQTSQADRRALLAAQRATARVHGSYVYLEIGSHLGGSIQPHLVDDRCTLIYSIDPRPARQPDDRSPGAVFDYQDNSTERMLALLARIGHGDLGKIRCIESDASRIDPATVAPRPHLALIDGQHTGTAVASDFAFCRKVIREDGTILFHDFSIVYRAVFEICRTLSRERCNHVPVKLDGDVFGIFFSAETVRSDPHLNARRAGTGRFLLAFRTRLSLRRWLPGWVLAGLRRVRRPVG